MTTKFFIPGYCKMRYAQVDGIAYYLVTRTKNVFGTDRMVINPLDIADVPITDESEMFYKFTNFLCGRNIFGDLFVVKINSTDSIQIFGVSLETINKAPYSEDVQVYEYGFNEVLLATANALVVTDSLITTRINDLYVQVISTDDEVIIIVTRNPMESMWGIKPLEKPIKPTAQRRRKKPVEPTDPPQVVIEVSQVVETNSDTNPS